MIKKTECLDDTSPEDIEEDVSDRKNDNSEKNDRKKLNAQMTPPLKRWRMMCAIKKRQY